VVVGGYSLLLNNQFSTMDVSSTTGRLRELFRPFTKIVGNVVCVCASATPMYLVELHSEACRISSLRFKCTKNERIKHVAGSPNDVLVSYEKSPSNGRLV